MEISFIVTVLAVLCFGFILLYLGSGIMKKVGFIVIALAVLYFGFNSSYFDTNMVEQNTTYQSEEKEIKMPDYTTPTQYIEYDEETVGLHYSDTQTPSTIPNNVDATQTGNDIVYSDPATTNGSRPPKRIECPSCQGGTYFLACSSCGGSGQSKLGEDVPAQTLPGGLVIPSMSATYVTCMLCGGNGLQPCYTCYKSGTVPNPEYVYTEEEWRIEQEAAMQMIDDFQTQNAYNRELDKQYREEQEKRHQQNLDRIREQGERYEAPDFGY